MIGDLVRLVQLAACSVCGLFNIGRGCLVCAPKRQPAPMASRRAEECNRYLASGGLFGGCRRVQEVSVLNGAGVGLFYWFAKHATTCVLCRVEVRTERVRTPF